MNIKRLKEFVTGEFYKGIMRGAKIAGFDEDKISEMGLMEDVMSECNLASLEVFKVGMDKISIIELDKKISECANNFLYNYLMDNVIAQSLNKCNK